MEPFIGQIMMFGGNFAPRGWALCDGQLLPIAQYSALFSILGTTYGGDGRTTFGLPDLRGRVPMHMGTGPGLSGKTLGAKAGSQTTTLTEGNMPSHTHTLRAEGTISTSGNPTDNMLGIVTGETKVYSLADPANEINMHADSITHTGGGQAFGNEQPYQVVNFVIALEGIFPSRS